MGFSLNKALCRIDEEVPTLKTYGMGVWLIWSFSTYSVSMWGSGADAAVGPQAIYFLSTCALLATTLILVFTKRGRAAAFSDRALLSVAAAASGAAAVLGVLGPGDVLAVRGLASVATGVGSGFLLVRTAHMFEDVGPKAALRIVLLNSLLLLVLHLVLESVPESIASVARSSCFVAAAFLFSLGSHRFAGGCQGTGELLGDEQDEMAAGCAKLPAMWRFFLTLFMVMLVLTLEVSCFYGPTVEADTAITVGALFITCVLFLCACCVRFEVDFTRLFHPVVIVLVIAFSLGMILGSDNVWSAALTGVSRVVWQTQFYAVCVFVAFRAGVPNAILLVVGHAATLSGDLVGRWLSLAMPRLDVYTPQGAVTLVLFVVAFLVVLTLVFPRERFVQMCVFAGDDEADCAERDSFEDAPGNKRLYEKGESSSSNWHLRCFAIADRHGLTARERDVLIPLTHGLSCERISDELGLSYSTVRAHSRNIYTKTGVHSKQELIDLVESAAE